MLVEVYDEFFSDSDIEKRIQYAETAKYETHEYDGVRYKEIHPLPSDRQVVKELEYIYEGTFEGFHVLRRGHNPTGWIHADTNCGAMAGVLYLTDHSDLTGTAFWSHHKYGQRADMTDKAQIAEVNADANDPTKWNLVKVVKGLKNRMLVYDSQLFHSVWPRFGPADRLVQCSFLTFHPYDEDTDSRPSN